MSFKVLKDLGNDRVQADLLPKIETWYLEVRKLLPNLPPKVQIYFFPQDSPAIMKEYGVGGYAYSSNILSLGFTLDFKDKTEQMKQLRSTIYHEGLHIAQGYTGECTELSLLHCAVYEGLATVFEREFVGTHQVYGDYRSELSKVPIWLRAISEIGPGWEYATYAKWGFDDKQTGEKYKLYKSGTWLIDSVLATNKNLTILDLTRMDAEQVLNIAKNFIENRVEGQQ